MAARQMERKERGTKEKREREKRERREEGKREKRREENECACEKQLQ